MTEVGWLSQWVEYLSGSQGSQSVGKDKADFLNFSNS